MFYNSFNAAMQERFGKKIYKLALDGGFTCPNRDGTLGDRGCIFCSLRGSGDFAETLKPGNLGGSGSCEGIDSDDIFNQIERAKLQVAEKFQGGPFVAYFQNFTNTYGSPEKMERLFSAAIGHPDIAALDVATRPDCLPPETVELLARLNEQKPVWVELGLQTVNLEVARYIRRGYDLPVFDRAVTDLKRAGLEVIVHMIIGLPGETSEDIYRTARYISDSGVDGIKMQLLHVLRGTDLALDYEAGKFKTLEMDEYIELLMGCIRRLRPEIVIHRMTGDGPKKDLIAPLWSANKRVVLNTINQVFRAADLIQGELLK